MTVYCSRTAGSPGGCVRGVNDVSEGSSGVGTGVVRGSTLGGYIVSQEGNYRGQYYL